MAKKQKVSPLKKGQSSFQLIGEAKINDYTFKIDEEAASGFVYNAMNLGVDCGNGNVVYADMMGGYSGTGDSVIYVHGKKENDNGQEVDDFSNRFTVDWEDRFDEEILEQVGRRNFVKVGIEKDTKGKTFSKSFLSGYDAIEYINEHLESGIVINVKGDLNYQMYDGNVQIRKNVTSIFLSRADDPSKYSAKFQQAILVDKDSIGKYDKEKQAFPISAYVVDYVGKHGVEKKEVRENVAFPVDFLFEVSEDKMEQGKKLLAKLFKVKKDNVNEITVEGDIIEGQAKTNITIDDIPDDIKELIDLGAYTEEEALERCAVGNTREKKMVIRKPVIRMVGDGDEKTPVIVKEDEKYKADDLMFLSHFIGDDEEEDDSEEEDSSEGNDGEENEESEDYNLDDLDDLLNEDG